VESSFTKIVVAIIGAVAVIGAAIIGRNHFSSSSGTASQTPTTRVPATQSTQSISFDPVTHAVPRCASFKGKGDVPQGRQLWVVVVTSENGRTKYYFDETSAAGGQWSAPKVPIGSGSDPTGELFKVWAVTFPDNISRDIGSGRYQNGTFHLLAKASIQDRISVKLSRNHAPC
jgi:hypothetical protein